MDLFQIFSSILKIQEPSQSAAEEASSDLFNPKSKIFVNSVVASCIMLLVFSIAGIAFQVCYLDPRNRMIEAAKSKLAYLFVCFDKTLKHDLMIRFAMFYRGQFYCTEKKEIESFTVILLNQ